MEQQAHFLTLSTPDLDAARRFYRDGLGWTPLLDVPDEIIFFQIAPGFVLGLFEAAKFDADLGGPATGGRTGGLTLSHNVPSPAEVDAAVRRAVEAGGTLVKSPARAAFGGYHGHVADPNGVIWEICHNPGWRIEPDGRVVLQAPGEMPSD
ncbi:putative glyoxalase/bleomycin resistance protein [Sphaerisporangium rufum]|uniref:Glyoxalase/bleomycin resistance protein n=1 Tax=Sphaerisporangium rufum TaxID=1381558 RepID=A0A919R9H4_9ACTN|nr:VOC family protein [Sphaerisporangium rufum]GII81874.1 putative glyoxalase/bleomycin resistance protein [Sphaerisporangium rufum]